MFAFADNIPLHFVMFCNSCPKHGCFVFVSCQIVSAGSYSFIGHGEHVCWIQQAILQDNIIVYFPFILAHNSNQKAFSWRTREHSPTKPVFMNLHVRINTAFLLQLGLDFYLISKYCRGLLFSAWMMYPPGISSITFSQGDNLSLLLLVSQPGFGKDVIMQTKTWTMCTS